MTWFILFEELRVPRALWPPLSALSSLWPVHLQSFPQILPIQEGSPGSPEPRWDLFTGWTDGNPSPNPSSDRKAVDIEQ